MPRETWATCCIDRLTHAGQELQDPGDEVVVDLAVANTPQMPLPATMKPVAGLRDGGVLLIRSDLSTQELWQRLAPEVQTAIKERNLQAFCTTPKPNAQQSGETDLAEEHVGHGLVMLNYSRQEEPTGQAYVEISGWAPAINARDGEQDVFSAR